MEEEGEEEKRGRGRARIGRRKKRQEEGTEERRRMRRMEDMEEGEGMEEMTKQRRRRKMRRWRRSNSSRSICRLPRGLVCKVHASTSRHQKPHLPGCPKLKICPLQGRFLEGLPTRCPFQLVARNRASSLLAQHEELSLGRIGHGAIRERGILVKEPRLMKLDVEDRLVLRSAAQTPSKTMAHCSGAPSGQWSATLCGSPLVCYR